MTTDTGTIELNIRLDLLGRSSTEAELNQRRSTALELLRQGGLPPRQIYDRRLVTGTAHLLIVQMPAQGVQEAEFYRLSERLSQDCISVYYPAQGRGLLLGPRAADWGEFSIEKFERFESQLNSLATPEARTDRLTPDLTAQALEWIAHREWLIESRSKLQESTGMLLSEKPPHLVVDDLPEPLRSEVLKQLSLKPSLQESVSPSQ